MERSNCSSYFKDNTSIEPQVIDEDEVIPKDTTPELIDKFQNADKHIPTIYDYIRMMVILNDVMSNQFKDAEENPDEPPRYLYNKDLIFLRYGNTEERSYILSLHKIHVVPFSKDDLEEKLKRWVRKEFKTFNKEARAIASVTLAERLGDRAGCVRTAIRAGDGGVGSDSGVVECSESGDGGADLGNSGWGSFVSKGSSKADGMVSVTVGAGGEGIDL
ncbi:hypothetical protein Tco_0733352 [Tanacetum coccineum]